MTHRVRAHGYRDPRRAKVVSTYCPLCREEMATLECCKRHYAARTCIEAQVEFRAESILAEEADLEPGQLEDPHSAFPIALRKGRGKLGDWEVGAMIGFVLSLASSYGNEGVPLGTLIAGYILCVQRSKWNALQQARQERYICAIVCSLCEQDALRASKHTPLTLLSTVEAVEDVDHNSSPLHNTMMLR